MGIEVVWEREGGEAGRTLVECETASLYDVPGGVWALLTCVLAGAPVGTGAMWFGTASDGSETYGGVEVVRERGPARYVFTPLTRAAIERLVAASDPLVLVERRAV